MFYSFLQIVPRFLTVSITFFPLFTINYLFVDVFYSFYEARHRLQKWPVTLVPVTQEVSMCRAYVLPSSSWHKQLLSDWGPTIHMKFL